MLGLLAALAAMVGGLVITTGSANAVPRGYYKLPYSSTVFRVTSSGPVPISYAQWSAAGFPVPVAPRTDYVRYPWSPTVYAVTYWDSDPDDWQWDALSWTQFVAAGRPAVRTAGYVVGSRYFQSGVSGDLYVRGADGVQHQLTFAEWAASGFHSFQPASAVDPEVTTDHETAGVPSWWDGWCNSTTHPGAHQLSSAAVLWGVVPCGGGTQRVVRFYTGAWGEFEWQCVEFAQRFMRLVYGTHPYGGNGSQVVWNYTDDDGGDLVTVPNGAGYAPVTGDVVSFGSITTNGHVAVVQSSDVNDSGDGAVTIVEQNYSAAGVRTLTVSDWTVSGGATGWLHHN